MLESHRARFLEELNLTHDGRLQRGVEINTGQYVPIDDIAMIYWIGLLVTKDMQDYTAPGIPVVANNDTIFYFESAEEVVAACSIVLGAISVLRSKYTTAKLTIKYAANVETMQSALNIYNA